MIIFDLGGVLLKEAECNLKKAASIEWQIDTTQELPRIFNKTFEFAHRVLNKECKKAWIMGTLQAEDIIKAIHEHIDKEEHASFFKDLHEKNLIKYGSEVILSPAKLVQWTELIEEGVAFIKKCKAHNMRVLILSNWDPYSFALLKVKFADFFSLFDEQDIFIPANIGFVKPELEVYTALLTQAALDKENTFFIDDSKTNVEGAQKAGIKAVVHKGNWQETEQQLIAMGFSKIH